MRNIPLFIKYRNERTQTRGVPHQIFFEVCQTTNSKSQLFGFDIHYDKYLLLLKQVDDQTQYFNEKPLLKTDTLHFNSEMQFDSIPLFYDTLSNEYEEKTIHIVAWIEGKELGGRVQKIKFAQTDIDLAPLLNEKLYRLQREYEFNKEKGKIKLGIDFTEANRKSYFKKSVAQTPTHKTRQSMSMRALKFQSQIVEEQKNLFEDRICNYEEKIKAQKESYQKQIHKLEQRLNQKDKKISQLYSQAIGIPEKINNLNQKNKILLNQREQAKKRNKQLQVQLSSKQKILEQIENQKKKLEQKVSQFEKIKETIQEYYKNQLDKYQKKFVESEKKRNLFVLEFERKLEEEQKKKQLKNEQQIKVINLEQILSLKAEGMQRKTVENEQRIIKIKQKEISQFLRRESNQQKRENQNLQRIINEQNEQIDKERGNQQMILSEVQKQKQSLSLRHSTLQVNHQKLQNQILQLKKQNEGLTMAFEAKQKENEEQKKQLLIFKNQQQKAREKIFKEINLSDDQLSFLPLNKKDKIFQIIYSVELLQKQVKKQKQQVQKMESLEKQYHIQLVNAYKKEDQLKETINKIQQQGRINKQIVKNLDDSILERQQKVIDMRTSYEEYINKLQIQKKIMEEKLEILQQNFSESINESQILSYPNEAEEQVGVNLHNKETKIQLSHDFQSSQGKKINNQNLKKAKNKKIRQKSRDISYIQKNIKQDHIYYQKIADQLKTIQSLAYELNSINKEVGNLQNANQSLEEQVSYANNTMNMAQVRQKNLLLKYQDLEQEYKKTQEVHDQLFSKYKFSEKKITQKLSQNQKLELKNCSLRQEFQHLKNVYQGLNKFIIQCILKTFSGKYTRFYQQYVQKIQGDDGVFVREINEGLQKIYQNIWLVQEQNKEMIKRTECFSTKKTESLSQSLLSQVSQMPEQIHQLVGVPTTDSLPQLDFPHQNKENLEFRSKYQKLAEELDQKEKQYQHVSAQFRKIKLKADLYSQTIEELEEQMKQVEVQLTKVMDQNKKMKVQLNGQTKEELKFEIPTFQSIKQSANVQHNQKKRIIQLEKKLKQAEKFLDLEIKKNEVLDEKIQYIKKQLHQKQEELKEIEKNLCQQRTEHQAFLQKAEEIEKKCIAEQRQNTKLKEKLNRLQKQNSQNLQVSETYQVHIKGYEKKILSLEEEKNEQFLEYQKQVKELRHQLYSKQVELQSEVLTLKAQSNCLHETIKSYEKRILSLETQVTAAKLNYEESHEKYLQLLCEKNELDETMKVIIDQNKIKQQHKSYEILTLKQQLKKKEQNYQMLKFTSESKILLLQEEIQSLI